MAQGTGLIRSHVDVCDPSLTALRALLELRDEVRDLVDLRLIAFPQDGILSFPNGKELMREAMRLGCDVIGGIPHYEWTREDGVEEVHFLFDLAKETGDNPFEPGQQRTVFIFTFKPANAVVDGTWRYYTGVSHKSQKLTAVLTALKVSGSSFKKSELLGREAQALIEVTEQGYTRITNVFPT